MKSNYSIYQKHSNYILGFHGCDKSVADKLLSTDYPDFKMSVNDYDWLGNGMYFWENDPNRALEFALQKQKWSPDNFPNPVVIGAIIDLGNCLNFLENQHILNLKTIYQMLKNSDFYLPKNAKAHSSDEDYLFRYLDKYAVELLVTTIHEDPKLSKIVIS